MLNVSLSVLLEALGWAFYVLVVPVVFCILIGAFRECWNGSALQRNFQKTSLARFKEQQTQQFIKNRLGQHHNQVLKRDEREMAMTQNPAHAPMVSHPTAAAALETHGNAQASARAHALNKLGSHEVESGSVWNMDDSRIIRRHAGSASIPPAINTPRSLYSGIGSLGKEREREREDDFGSTWAQEERLTPHRAMEAMQGHGPAELGLGNSLPRGNGVVQRVSKIWQQKKQGASGERAGAEDAREAPEERRELRREMLSKQEDPVEKEPRHDRIPNGHGEVVAEELDGGGKGSGDGRRKVAWVVAGLFMLVLLVGSTTCGIICLDEFAGGKLWTSAGSTFNDCLRLVKASRLAETSPFCSVVGRAQAPVVTAKVYILLACTASGLRHSLHVTLTDAAAQASVSLSSAARSVGKASSELAGEAGVPAELVPAVLGMVFFVCFRAVLAFLSFVLNVLERWRSSVEAVADAEEEGFTVSPTTKELEAEAEEQGLSLDMPVPFDGGMLARQLSDDVLMDLRQQFEAFKAKNHLIAASEDKSEVRTSELLVRNNVDKMLALAGFHR